MIDGKQRPRSAETTDYQAACDELKRLEGMLAQGAPITHRTGRCLFKEIAADMERNYAIKKRASLKDLKRNFEKHINPFFGYMTLASIKTAKIEEYVQHAGLTGSVIHSDGLDGLLHRLPSRLPEVW
jgi:hypothetical protein